MFSSRMNGITNNSNNSIFHRSTFNDEQSSTIDSNISGKFRTNESTSSSLFKFSNYGMTGNEENGDDHPLSVPSTMKIEKVHGMCSDMCPLKERQQRYRESVHSIYEKSYDQLTNSWELSDDLMVKDFIRSAADQDIAQPSDLRPVPVLHRTLKHVLKHVGGQPSLGGIHEWYTFIWSRTRAIRKDLTQQSAVTADVMAANMLEMCVRFHIWCAARYRDESEFKAFDYQLNKENLDKTLKSLKDIYDDSWKKTNHKNGINHGYNEDEMFSYRILQELPSVTQPFNDLRKMSKERYKFLLSSPPVQLALELKQLYFTKNWSRFFRLIESDSVTLFQSCIIHQYFYYIRYEILKNIIISTRTASALIPLSQVYDTFFFDSIDQLTQFLALFKLISSKGVDLMLEDSISFRYDFFTEPPSDQEEPLKRWRSKRLCEKKLFENNEKISQYFSMEDSMGKASLEPDEVYVELMKLISLDDNLFKERNPIFPIDRRKRSTMDKIQFAEAIQSDKNENKTKFMAQSIFGRKKVTTNISENNLIFNNDIRIGDESFHHENNVALQHTLTNSKLINERTQALLKNSSEGKIIEKINSDTDLISSNDNEEDKWKIIDDIISIIIEEIIDIELIQLSSGKLLQCTAIEFDRMRLLSSSFNNWKNYVDEKKRQKTMDRELFKELKLSFPKFDIDSVDLISLRQFSLISTTSKIVEKLNRKLFVLFSHLLGKLKGDEIDVIKKRKKTVSYGIFDDEMEMQMNDRDESYPSVQFTEDYSYKNLILYRYETTDIILMNHQSNYSNLYKNNEMSFNTRRKENLMIIIDMSTCLCCQMKRWIFPYLLNSCFGNNSSGYSMDPYVQLEFLIKTLPKLQLLIFIKEESKLNKNINNLKRLFILTFYSAFLKYFNLEDMNILMNDDNENGNENNEMLKILLKHLIDRISIQFFHENQNEQEMFHQLILEIMEESKIQQKSYQSNQSINQMLHEYDKIPSQSSTLSNHRIPIIISSENTLNIFELISLIIHQKIRKQMTEINVCQFHTFTTTKYQSTYFRQMLDMLVKLICSMPVINVFKPNDPNYRFDDYETMTNSIKSIQMLDEYFPRPKPRLFDKVKNSLEMLKIFEELLDEIGNNYKEFIRKMNEIWKMNVNGEASFQWFIYEARIFTEYFIKNCNNMNRLVEEQRKRFRYFQEFLQYYEIMESKLFDLAYSMYIRLFYEISSHKQIHPIFNESITLMFFNETLKEFEFRQFFFDNQSDNNDDDMEDERISSILLTDFSLSISQFLSGLIELSENVNNDKFLQTPIDTNDNVDYVKFYQSSIIDDNDEDCDDEEMMEENYNIVTVTDELLDEINETVIDNDPISEDIRDLLHEESTLMM
ncbi:hypothetical protein SNEBB_010999 [Seison nebaliae]|nr:hypothetical protein SNEBB_010999 [Seison nebaliae]